jgi:hypothetical protein
MSTSALTAPYSKAAQSDAGDIFADALLICLLLISIPIKNSAYLVPPAFVAVQAFFGNTAFARRSLLWLCIAVCTSSISIMIDSLSGRTVSLPGVLFGVLTYASLAVIMALRCDFTIRADRYQQIRMAVACFMIIQSVLGMLQFAASGLSDAICGTFGLFDFRGTVTIGQVYLTFNLIAMSMFLMTDMRGVLAKVAVGLAMLTSALAHSGHQTIFLIASIGIVGVLQLRLKDLFKVAAVLFIVLGLTATVSTVYWRDLQDWAGKLIFEESPKAMATRGAAEILISSKNLLIGTGMGQYGSRAGLIASGQYLSVPLPGFLVGESQYFQTYLVPAIDEHAISGQGSAISQPFFSVLNLTVEFGLPFLIVLVGAAASQFVANWWLSRSDDTRTRAVGVLANCGLLFFILCCFIENYAEFSQAIFLPALLYVAARASIDQRPAVPATTVARQRRRRAGGRHD